MFGTHRYSGRAKGVLKHNDPIVKVRHQGEVIYNLADNLVLVENEAGLREWVCPCSLKIIRPQERMNRLI